MSSGCFRRTWRRRAPSEGCFSASDASAINRRGMPSHIARSQHLISSKSPELGLANCPAEFFKEWSQDLGKHEHALSNMLPMLQHSSCTAVKARSGSWQLMPACDAFPPQRHLCLSALARSARTASAQKGVSSRKWVSCIPTQGQCAKRPGKRRRATSGDVSTAWRRFSFPISPVWPVEVLNLASRPKPQKKRNTNISFRPWSCRASNSSCVSCGRPRNGAAYSPNCNG